MSVLITLGSIGIGAVIGWLLGLLEPNRKLFSQIMAAGMASLLVLLDIVWQAGLQAALIALGSGFAALLIHKLWRRSLRDH